MLLALLIAAGNASCSREAEGTSGAKQDWLHGDVDERFGLVAKHLRGFDMAMVETGHRYAELYWAGRDRNWGYAEYQLGKIELAVANGLERRPLRAESAKMLQPAVDGVRSAITTKDAEAFDRAFDTLTSTCNSCHVAENVEFVKVAEPKVRLSPVDAGR